MTTSEDEFLGGRLRLRQPSVGYRAGADPVFLAASVPASPGDKVLELGCGVGTALFCLMLRVPDLDVTGVELVEDYVRMARENGASNGLEARIVLADIAKLPTDLTAQTFDHVLFNPPFFDRQTGSSSSDAGREIGRAIQGDLAIWADVALRRLRPGGTLSVVHRTEKLPDLLVSLRSRAGDIRVLPLQPRPGKPSKLFVLTAKKASNGPFSLLSPLVLHKGAQHLQDGDSYTPEVQAILRNGAALEAIVNG